MTDLLWTPGKTRAAQTTLAAFSGWMSSRAGKSFAGYEELHGDDEPAFLGGLENDSERVRVPRHDCQLGTNGLSVAKVMRIGSWRTPEPLARLGKPDWLSRPRMPNRQAAALRRTDALH